MRKGFVYKITSPSGRIYVGSTMDFKKRFKHYRNLDCKRQVKLLNSFLKYGFDSHCIEILEECEFNELFSRERYYGILLNTIAVGLNLVLPSDGQLKAVVSEATRLKMSNHQLGVGNNFYGKKYSIESMEKRRLAYKNLSDTSRKRISEGQLNRKMSEESKLRMKKKMSFSQTGRKHSEKTKSKMRCNNPKIKWVLHLETGIYYLGVKEAANIFNFKQSTLTERLNGRKPNNTGLIYA